MKKSAIMFVLLLIPAVTLFAQDKGQNNLNKFFKNFPDSLLKKLPHNLKDSALIITRQTPNHLRSNMPVFRVPGNIDNMPVFRPDSSYADNMPVYRPFENKIVLPEKELKKLVP